MLVHEQNRFNAEQDNHDTVKPEEEAHFRVLQAVARQPDITQRELAEQLGLSLGKTNFLINALLEKGAIKMEGFRRSDTKLKKIAYLLTPSGSHARFVKQALQAGKHVFVEKPLCLTLDELADIESRVASFARPPIVMVGFNRRFAPQVQRMKQLLSGATGPKAFVMTVNAGALPVVFPVHPRTAKTLRGLAGVPSNIRLVDPQPYLEFNYLVKHAKAVITDSGGITEETTVMGVPCITLRDTTERPETVTVGTNELIGTDPAAIKPALDRLFAGDWKEGAIPDLWDGRAGERIVAILERVL